MTQTTHFAFLLVEEFTHLAFACAVEPLRIANLVSGKPLYKWSLISQNGHSATCSNGSVTLAGGGLEPIRHVDRLFLISGINVQNHVTPDLLNFLRHERARGTALGAICSGAYVLAKAGFLDGMEVAIHWDYHDLFAEEFPYVNLIRNVFSSDEKIITASGGTAAADLMLHIIREQHGNDLATLVADQMVYNSVREGTAAQRVSVQSKHGMRNTHLVKAISLMEENIEEPISPSMISDELGISIRQLERLFGRHMGATPKNYYTDLRLHRARNLLVQSDRSITEIAIACGFRSTSHFSRVFKKHFGVSPSEQKSRLH